MGAERSEQNVRRSIEEKASLITTYRDVTLQMKSSLEKKEDKAIVMCIDKRQRVISEVEKIDRCLKESSRQGSFGTAPELQGLLDHMTLMLSEISTLEKECFRLAEADHQDLKSQILNNRQIRRVAEGYRSKDAAPARFVDTRIR